MSLNCRSRSIFYYFIHRADYLGSQNNTCDLLKNARARKTRASVVLVADSEVKDINKKLGNLLSNAVVEKRVHKVYEGDR